MARYMTARSPSSYAGAANLPSRRSYNLIHLERMGTLFSFVFDYLAVFARYERLNNSCDPTLRHPMGRHTVICINHIKFANYIH